VILSSAVRAGGEPTQAAAAGGSSPAPTGRGASGRQPVLHGCPGVAGGRAAGQHGWWGVRGGRRRVAVEAGGERGEDATTAGGERRPDEEHHTEVTMATECLVVWWVGNWLGLPRQWLMCSYSIFLPVSKTQILAPFLDFNCFVRIKKKIVLI